MSVLIAQYGLLIVGLVIFCGEIGLPTLVPGEIALLFAGSQIIHSTWQLAGAIVIFAFIDALATTTIHIAARTGGNRLLIRLLRRLTGNQNEKEHIIERWRRRLGGRDKVVVFVTRLIPMFRLYASITTGLIRIRFRDFACGAWPAALVWATIPLTLGYVLRGNVRDITTGYASAVQWIILGSLSITVALGMAAWLKHAGQRLHVLRRARFLLGVIAVTGAGVRLFTLAIAKTGIAGHQIPGTFIPSASTWISIIALVTFGLMWIAAQDLRVICERRHRGHIGVGSAISWVSLLVVLGVITAGTTVPAFAL